MPLYEYHCASCDKTHEIMQKFSEAPLETCPDCGGSLEKLMSLSSFALKGAGWYTTDYRKRPKEKVVGEPCPAAKSGVCASGGCPSAATG
jgi:putative FmdB family regulatory protein